MPTKDAAVKEVNGGDEIPVARTASNLFLQAMAAFAGTQGASISLHTASPGNNGANEVTGGGYARQTTTWGAPTMQGANSQVQGSDVTFTVPASTTVSFFGVWQAAQFQYGAALSPTITIGGSGPGTVIVTPVYQEQPG